MPAALAAPVRARVRALIIIRIRRQSANNDIAHVAIGDRSRQKLLFFPPTFFLCLDISSGVAERNLAMQINVSDPRKRKYQIPRGLINAYLDSIYVKLSRLSI